MAVTDLARITTAAELAVGLDALRGDLSYGELDRRARHLPPERGPRSLASSTLSDLLNKGRTSQETLETFLAACGVAAQADVVEWVRAWKRTREDTGSLVGAVRVRDCDPHLLGVHKAISVSGARGDQPAYVERDTDQAQDGVRALVAAAAGQGGFVLLVGGSSVGKTRCAYEAVAGLLPDWWLVHPDPLAPEEVTSLSRVPPLRTVVWVDELQRYLEGECALTAGMIRALLRADHPVVVIATLWSAWYTVYAQLPMPGARDVNQGGRELLELAHTVHIRDRLSPAERARAVELARDDPRIRTALQVEGYGLTQTIAAAPQLIEHWENAEPYAAAVLDTAIDAAHLGVRSPLSADLLRAVAPGYCDRTARAHAPSNWFEDAVAYATRPLHGAAAALEPQAAGMGRITGYLIAEYLLHHSYQRRQGGEPAELWDALMTHTRGSDDLERLAEAADSRELYRCAAVLYKRAAAAGSGHSAVMLVHLLDFLDLDTYGAAAWAAEHISLSHPGAVTQLLQVLPKAGGREVADVLASRVAQHTPLVHPADIAHLVDALLMAGSRIAAEALLQPYRMGDVPLDDALGLAELLNRLRKIGTRDAVRVLASRVAQHTPLIHPADAAHLVRALIEAGAREQAETLLDRTSMRDLPLGTPGAVAALLETLMWMGSNDVAEDLLRGDPAQHAQLNDPLGVARLLKALQRAGRPDAVRTLAHRAVQHKPDDFLPQTAAELLKALHDTGQRDVAHTLAQHCAEEARLDNPRDVGRLLNALHGTAHEEAELMLALRAVQKIPPDDRDMADLLEALGQSWSHMRSESGEIAAPVRALLSRDIVQHARLDDTESVIKLMSALRSVGAEEEGRALARRAAQYMPLDDPTSVGQMLKALKSKPGSPRTYEILARRADDASVFTSRGSVTAKLTTSSERSRFRYARKSPSTPIPPWRSSDLPSTSLERSSFRYGKEPSGRPTPPWCWSDLP